MLIEDLKKDAQAAYDGREAEIGDEIMRELERRVVLSVLDRKWREHLYEMDYLREGIYLRAYSQRDPLVEYQREGFDMFTAMMDGIKEESVGFLFNLEVEVEERGGGTRPRTRSPSDAEAGRSRRPRDAAHIRAKGLDAPKAPHEAVLLRPRRGRRGRASGAVADASRRVRRRRPQRRLPLWLRQEVQEVPRRPRRAHRSHDARQRLRVALATEAAGEPAAGSASGSENCGSARWKATGPAERQTESNAGWLETRNRGRKPPANRTQAPCTATGRR